jgi:hypothetical protein
MGANKINRYEAILLAMGLGDEDLVPGNNLLGTDILLTFLFAARDGMKEDRPGRSPGSLD